MDTNSCRFAMTMHHRPDYYAIAVIDYDADAARDGLPCERRAGTARVSYHNGCEVYIWDGPSDDDTDETRELVREHIANLRFREMQEGAHV